VSTDALREMRKELESDEFRCPGNHRTYVAPWDSLGSPKVELAFDPGLGKFTRAPWVEWGQCSGMIRIDLDSEADDMGYVLYEYPVASSEGACVRALGLEDDEYRHPIWGQYAERKRLLKVLKNVCTNLGVYREVFDGTPAR